MAHGMTTLAVRDILAARDEGGGEVIQTHGPGVVASITIVPTQDIPIAICVNCQHIDLICRNVYVSQNIQHVDETVLIKGNTVYTSIQVEFPF